MIGETWMLIVFLGGQIDKLPAPIQMPMNDLLVCQEAGKSVTTTYTSGKCNLLIGCRQSSAQCISSNGDVYSYIHRDGWSKIPNPTSNVIKGYNDKWEK